MDFMFRQFNPVNAIWKTLKWERIKSTVDEATEDI
jgi:hypothetical protein